MFAGTRSQIAPHRNTSRSVAGTSDSAARLDSDRLDRLANLYFVKGLAQSTERSYGSAKKRYLAFCDLVGETPVPATVATLQVHGLLGSRQTEASVDKGLFLSSEAPAHRKGRSRPSLPRLEYTLRGVKRCEAEAGVGKRERLPINRSHNFTEGTGRMGVGWDWSMSTV